MIRTNAGSLADLQRAFQDYVLESGDGLTGSVRDTDARIGEIVDAIERAGAFDSTAFVLVADHGMQQTDPAVTGDWDDALRDAGIRFRDEGYGFLYLGDDITG